MAQMVHPELHLEPIGGLGFGDRHHPGVVDQDVEGGVLGCDSGRRLADRVERGKVERDYLKEAIRDCGPQLLYRPVGLLRLPGGDHYGCPGRGECPGVLLSEATVGAGDDGRSAVQVRDVGFVPGHTEGFPSVADDRAVGVVVNHLPTVVLATEDVGRPVDQVALLTVDGQALGVLE